MCLASKLNRSRNSSLLILTELLLHFCGQNKKKCESQELLITIPDFRLPSQELTVAETYTDNTIFILYQQAKQSGKSINVTCSATSRVTKLKTKIDDKKVPKLSGLIELEFKFKTIQHCQNLQFFINNELAKLLKAKIYNFFNLFVVLYGKRHKNKKCNIKQCAHISKTDQLIHLAEEMHSYWAHRLGHFGLQLYFD